LGGSLPRYIFGGQLEGGYKGFDLAISFQGVGKQHTMIPDAMVRPFMSAWTTPPQIIDGHYWSLYNTEAQNLAARYPRLSTTSANNNNYETSDFWMMNGAYFRLKNITLGYSLPSKVTDRMKLDNLRIYGSVTDLFSLDHFPAGWDPEAAADSYISKSFILGLSVRF